MKLTRQPMVLQDWAGYRFWQYPGDMIKFNVMRNAISDCENVTRYVHEHVTPGSVCIDIGANIGGLTIPLWSRATTGGRVVSVEADPRNMPRISANLRLNGCPDHEVVNVAVADRNGTTKLRCYPQDCNGWQTLGDPSSWRDYDSFTVDVPTVTFSTLVSMCRLDQLDFVKIDVEGAELMVLDGMVDLLKAKAIGCVVFEVNHLTLEGLGLTVADLMGFWERLDYGLARLDQDGTCQPLTTEWPEGLIGDCVAVPGEQQLG